jgi:MoaA/NifB/PqqE/SkfB family radical SAM enzyme
LRNALVFRYHKIRARPLKPTAISLALTHRCNSHCIMCNIWKVNQEFPESANLELSSQEIHRLFSNPLFSNLVEIDFTGGEPHLRDDLLEIVSGIANLKPTHLPRLRSLIVTSNGLMPEKIILNYERILAALRDVHIDLVAVSSLDGVGDVHDKIRGTRGAYGQILRTIYGLTDLQRGNPNFIAGIKTTVLPFNVSSLDDILEFALSRGLFHIISPVFFTEARFGNMGKKNDLSLKPDENKKIQEFYRRKELQNSYLYGQIRNSPTKGRRPWGCSASYTYLFIEFDGKVYPCEMAAEPVGDVRKQDPWAIWTNQEFRNWRKKMKSYEMCRNCCEPGAIHYSAYSEGSSYLKFLRGLNRPDVRITVKQDGLSKYFDR